MANPFQPGDAKSTDTTQVTPSPAAQASAEFRARILGQLLDAAAQPRTSFSQFAGGAPLQPLLPGGLSLGIPDLLKAMSQPGAFTSTRTDVGTGRPPTPSTFSDLAQLGALGALLYQSGALGSGLSGLGNILTGVGGALGIGGVNPALGDTTPSATGATLDPSLYENTDLGMSVDPNASPDILSFLGLGY